MQKLFCPKVFLSEILEKASESFLSEVVFPKVFRPKVFDVNVHSGLTMLNLCLNLCSFNSPTNRRCINALISKIIVRLPFSSTFYYIVAVITIHSVWIVSFL